jgi:hypothetical protein
MGKTMKNATIVLEEAYLVCLLMTAYLTGSNKITLEVLYDYHIVL